MSFPKKKSDSVSLKTFQKWPFSKDFEVEGESNNIITSIRCKVCSDNYREIRLEATARGISGPPLLAIVKYVNGVKYVHKGNVEKHIRSGSLHQWAKEKFSSKLSGSSDESNIGSSTVSDDDRDHPQSKPENCLMMNFVTERAHKSYTHLFNTAFSLVMAEKPYSDFPIMIAMQKRNGIEFLPGKDDEFSCSVFVHFLSEAIKSDIQSILSMVNFFAGEMDGSDARKTKEEKELIYCKVAVRGQPVELFLKCQKMADFGGVDAQCTKQAFDNAFLHDYNLSEERFSNLLIAVCADGASVNMGGINGACTLMKSSRPWLVVIHCANHCLELAVNDAYLADQSFRLLDEMMVNIYHLFRNSGKNKWFLTRVAQRLSVTSLSFVNTKGTRFQAHHYHGIRVMIVNYLPLLTFAENMIEGDSRTCRPELKAQLQGYHNQWVTYAYLGSLELYRRVLRLTSHLSLTMQSQSVLVSDVLDGLEECKLELDALAAASPEDVFPFLIDVHDSDDKATLTATATNLPATAQFRERAKMTEKQQRQADKCMAVIKESFELKQIKQGKEKVQKIKTDLIPAIVSCIDQRYQSLQEPVIQAMRIVDHSTWDLDDQDYGKAWVHTLAEHYSVPLSKHNFNLDLALRELNGIKTLKATKFKAYHGKISLWAKIFEGFQQKYCHFLLIIELCLCVIFSSATVERGFSTVKRHLQDSMLNLTNKSLNELLLVRINAPLLQQLDPYYEEKLVQKAVRMYMNSPELERGQYQKTTRQHSRTVLTMDTAAELQSPDLFLPSPLSSSTAESENELLGDMVCVGSISESSSDSESLSEIESD